jgi:hemerythrin
MDVTIFLADWLTHHINDVDMRYVDFFKKQQEG